MQIQRLSRNAHFYIPYDSSTLPDAEPDALLLSDINSVTKQHSYNTEFGRVHTS